MGMPGKNTPSEMTKQIPRTSSAGLPSKFQQNIGLQWHCQFLWRFLVGDSLRPDCT